MLYRAVPPMFKSGAIRRRLWTKASPAKGKSSAAAEGCQEAVLWIPGMMFPPWSKCVIQMSTFAEDVKRAIDDLEELYQAVEVNGNLADEKFDFMKSELIIKDAMDIKKKVLTHSILFKHQCQVLL